MTSSPSAQPPSTSGPGSDAGALGGQAGVARGRAGGAVVGSAASPAATPAIDAAMVRALELARAAGEVGEVPVGAVVLSPDGTVLAEATKVSAHPPSQVCSGPGTAHPTWGRLGATATPA